MTTISRPAPGLDRARMANLIAECASPPYRTIDRLLADVSISPSVRNTIYGVLRRFDTLNDEVTRRLRQPIEHKHRVINYLMMIGAHQILFERTATYAAVSECVEACRTLRRPWATGLVNAVLRAIARDHEAILEKAERSFELPDWLMRALSDSYGERSSAIARALLNQPIMTLRVNRKAIDPQQYALRLTAAGCTWKQGNSPETLLLDDPVSQQSLPGYAEGLVSVQDAGAQFAARLLSPSRGDRVLDLCAAPGGKLFHLIELFPEAEYTAIEVSPDRAERVRTEGSRLNLSDAFTLSVADGRAASWWDGRAFRHILLDAPCTGTGTIRRHPDIRIHRSAQDVERAVELQSELLDGAWPSLEPGGSLLYCTCSILEAENDHVIQNFLSSHVDAAAKELELPTGMRTSYGWQLLPDDPTTDGFYYALLQKRVP